MAKVALRVIRDAAYPVFVVVRNGEKWEFEIELSEEEGSFVRKAKQDFDQAQDILARAYEKARRREK